MGPPSSSQIQRKDLGYFRKPIDFLSFSFGCFLLKVLEDKEKITIIVDSCKVTANFNKSKSQKNSEILHIARFLNK